MIGSTTFVCFYRTSWYVWLFAEATLIALLCWIMGMVMNVYKWSSPGVMFLWLWLFCLNFVSFGALFSTFFDSLVSDSVLVSVSFSF